jgi:hypothetical protein
MIQSLAFRGFEEHIAIGVFLYPVVKQQSDCCRVSSFRLASVYCSSLQLDQSRRKWILGMQDISEYVICNFSDISDELNLGSRTIVSSLHSISVSHHLESNVRIRHTRSFHARRLSEYSLLSQLLHFPQVTTERGILHSHSSKDSFRKVLGAVSLEQKAHVNDQGLGVAQT